MGAAWKRLEQPVADRIQELYGADVKLYCPDLYAEIHDSAIERLIDVSNFTPSREAAGIAVDQVLLWEFPGPDNIDGLTYAQVLDAELEEAKLKDPAYRDEEDLVV